LAFQRANLGNFGAALLADLGFVPLPDDGPWDLLSIIPSRRTTRSER